MNLTPSTPEWNHNDNELQFYWNECFVNRYRYRYRDRYRDKIKNDLKRKATINKKTTNSSNVCENFVNKK